MSGAIPEGSHTNYTIAPGRTGPRLCTHTHTHVYVYESHTCVTGRGCCLSCAYPGPPEPSARHLSTGEPGPALPSPSICPPPPLAGRAADRVLLPRLPALPIAAFPSRCLLHHPPSARAPLMATLLPCALDTTRGCKSTAVVAVGDTLVFGLLQFSGRFQQARVVVSHAALS